jgi:hypothetical protein
VPQSSGVVHLDDIEAELIKTKRELDPNFNRA